MVGQHMQQGTPSRSSRRTLTRGAAWAAPTVALAAAAPSFAGSPGECEGFSFGATSCKCPGNSKNLKFGYYLSICVDFTGSCLPPGTETITVLSIKNNADKPGVSAPSDPYCDSLPTAITVDPILNSGCSATIRFSSESSASSLQFTYSIPNVSGTFTSPWIDAPSHCLGSECDDEYVACET